MDIDKKMVQAVKNLELSFSAIEEYSVALESELQDLQELKRDTYSGSQAIRAILLMNYFRSGSIRYFRKVAKEEFAITTRSGSKEVMRRLVKEILSRTDVDINVSFDENGKPKFYGNIKLNNQISTDNKKFDLNKRQIDLQFQSALLTLTNSFELFFQTLLECSYDTVLRSKLNSKNASFEELRNLTTIEEIKSLYMVKATEEIKRGPVASWFKAFEKLGFNDRDSLHDDLMSLSEIFDVRNLIVHNGGYVNSKFRKLHPDSRRKVDDRVQITTRYLHASVRCMRRIYINLVFSVWPKMSKCSLPSSLLEVMFNVGVDLLKPGCIESQQIFEKIKVILWKTDHKLEEMLPDGEYHFPVYFNYLLSTSDFNEENCVTVDALNQLADWLRIHTKNVAYLLSLDLFQHKFSDAERDIRKITGAHKSLRFLADLASWPIVLYDKDVQDFLDKTFQIREYMAKGAY